MLRPRLLHADTGLTEDVHDWSSLGPGADPSWAALEALSPPSATQQIKDLIALEVQPAKQADSTGPRSPVLLLLRQLRMRPACTARQQLHAPAERLGRLCMLTLQPLL